MIPEKTEQNAKFIAQFLIDHKCLDVQILDVNPECSWADCFIIGTVNSTGHLSGVAHELWGELSDIGLEVSNRRKSPSGDGWTLIDCGDIVIHLMSSELREFYSLEKLWAKKITE
ncbi:MAG: ribosome silencing factor [Sphaerochaetaceae bacterium]